MADSRPLRATLLALTILLSLLGAGLPVLAQSTPVPTPVMPVHGISMADMDLAVSPGDDFYRSPTAAGWTGSTSRRTVAYGGTHRDQRPRHRPATRLAPGRGSPRRAPAGSDEAKAGAIFAQGLDMAARDRRAIAPIQDALDRIAAIDLGGLPRLSGSAPFDGVGGAALPFEASRPDLKASTDATRSLSRGPRLSAVGLPNRDYYLDDDPALDAVRQAYRHGRRTADGGRIYAGRSPWPPQAVMTSRQRLRRRR